MRKISLALAFIASLLTLPAQAANFSAKDAAAATIIFTNPGNCTTGCVPIFSWYDSTGANAVAVVTAGADGASNTANGGLTYGRNLVFNGTTWDRWNGDLTNGGWVNVKTSVLPTGAATAAGLTTINTTLGTPMQNSGGSVTANLGTIGTAATSANQTSQITQETATAAALGTTADAPCTLPATTTACSQIAVAKATANAANSSVAAGSAIIGKVGVDQTTPGTTNGVTPTDGTNTALVDPCQSGTKVYTPVNVVTATNIIIAGVASKKKYICGMFLYPGGTDNIAIYQATTSTSCATAAVGVIGGATTATGIIATAQAGFVLPTTGYAHAATTVNQTDLCITTSAAVQLSGVVVTVDR